MELQEKKRDYLFDNIRGLLIILVVFGHSIRPRTDNMILDGIYTFIYIFHMPAFIFISGYFCKNVQKSHDTAIKTFLVPFLVLNFLSYLLNMGLGSNLYFFNINIFDAQWGLWFLLSMFLWRFFLKEFIQIKHILIVSVLIGLFTGLFKGFGAYLSIGRMFAFLPFFIAGYLFNSKHLKKLLSLPKIISYASIVVVALITVVSIVYDLIPNEMLYFRTAYRYSELNTVNGTLMRFGLYILGVMMTFALISIFSHKKTFLTKLGQNTLTVYIAHLFVLTVLLPTVELIGNDIIFSLICIALTVIITVVFSRPMFAQAYNKSFDFISNLIFKKPKANE